MVARKQYFYALSMFVGTIVGVGLFGMPYVGAQAGFITLVIFLILIGGLSILMNFYYGEIAAKTKGLHRLPGYAKIYLGNNGKRIAFIVKTLAIFGALLAYLIVGGQFLANLFDGSVYLYTFIFFIFGAFLIWRDQRSIGPVEFIMLFIFLGIVAFLFFMGVRHIQPSNLAGFNSAHFFAPYGVILFSLWGTSMIPEVKEKLKGDLKRIRTLVVWGISTCVIVYFVFSLLVIGVSGEATSEDALSGLDTYLGSWVITIGYIFGVITTFTSFITLGLTVKKIFWYDYGLPKRLGWALACFIPLIMFVAGFRDFITVIGLTGAVMLGIDGILVAMIFLKLKKKEKSARYGMWRGLNVVIIPSLVLGIVLEFLYFFNVL